MLLRRFDLVGVAGVSAQKSSFWILRSSVSSRILAHLENLNVVQLELYGIHLKAMLWNFQIKTFPRVPTRCVRKEKLIDYVCHDLFKKLKCSMIRWTPYLIDSSKYTTYQQLIERSTNLWYRAMKTAVRLTPVVFSRNLDDIISTDHKAVLPWSSSSNDVKRLQLHFSKWLRLASLATAGHDYDLPA